MNIINAAGLPAISNTERDLINRSLTLIQAKSGINETRSQYYDGKQPVSDVINEPAGLKKWATVLGWPAKAVDILESRIDLDGFFIPGGELSDFGLDQIVSNANLDAIYHQAHTTAFKYGCCYLSVVLDAKGYAVIKPLSPRTTGGVFSVMRQEYLAGVTIVECDEKTLIPKTLIGFFADRWVVWENHNGGWVAQTIPHNMGVVPLKILPNNPSLEAPFGRSRISQAVMAITDRAIRTLRRAEINASFYAAPQRYLIGAMEDQFTSADGSSVQPWAVSLSQMLAIPGNEDGTPMQIGQFPQMTMQPHLDMLRADAALFAGETNIPVNVLGIIHDNPASNEAMHTAYLSLNKEAERAHDTFGKAWVEILQIAWRIQNHTELPEKLRRLKAHFKDPATPTKQALAQSVVAQVQAGILPAQSETTFALLGYDEATRNQLKQHIAATTSQNLLGQLLREKPSVLTSTKPASKTPEELDTNG